MYWRGYSIKSGINRRIDFIRLRIIKPIRIDRRLSISGFSYDEHRRRRAVESSKRLNRHNQSTRSSTDTRTINGDKIATIVILKRSVALKRLMIEMTNIEHLLTMMMLAAMMMSMSMMMMMTMIGRVATFSFLFSLLVFVACGIRVGVVNVLVVRVRSSLLTRRENRLLGHDDAW